MIWKRTLSLTLAALLTLTPAARCVESEPWYAEAERFIYQEGLMNGVEEGFAPTALATRAAVFQALWNLEGQPYPKTAGMFSDVSIDAWYATAASWAQENGLASGDHTHAFRGSAVITRAELATIFHRYLLNRGFPEIDLPAGENFTDLDEVPDWGLEGMLFCVGYGILSGDKDRLMPNAAASQAELAAMLMAISRLTPPEQPEGERYLEGFLNATYLGKFDPEYLTLAGLTEKEAQRAYDKQLKDSANYFLAIYNVEYPKDEMREALKEIYAQVYSHLDFQILDSAEGEDGSRGVYLSIAPLNIIRITDSALPAAMKDFYAKYPVETQLKMTTKEYKAMDQEWGERLIDLFRERASLTRGLAAETLYLQPQQDEKGTWSLDEESAKRLDEAIIQYFPVT